MEFKNMSNDNIGNITTDEEVVNDTQNTQELNDIDLANSQEEGGKKKYLVLALALITLFIVTIIVVKVVSNVASDDNLLVEQKTETIDQDKMANMTSEQRFQATNVEEPKVDTEANTMQNQIEEAKQLVQAQEQQAVQTIEVKKQEPIQALKKEVENKKQTIIEAPKETSFTGTKVGSGSYIQLGAFSKYPSQKYLDGISAKGYKYTVDKVIVNGKTLNKVLVGPYTSKADARKALPKVKIDLKSPGAYIYK